MKPKMSRRLMLAAAVAMLSGSTVVYAATTLFTQTIPGQTFVTASMTAGSCSGTPELDTYLSYAPGGFASNPAQMIYDCNPDPLGATNTGTAAFSTQGSTSITVTATPTFTVPTGWTLGVEGKPSSGSSTECNGMTALTSGTPVTLAGGTSFVYCLSTKSASSFSSFSVSWTR